MKDRTLPTPPAPPFKPARKDVAEEIADDLFKNGYGEIAECLILRDKDGRDLGGWCKQAVIDRIALRLR